MYRNPHTDEAAETKHVQNAHERRISVSKVKLAVTSWHNEHAEDQTCNCRNSMLEVNELCPIASCIGYYSSNANASWELLHICSSLCKLVPPNQPACSGNK